MTASIQAKSNGTQGSLQVNGADAVVFDSTGITAGVNKSAVSQMPVFGTPITLSGTTQDITGIPSWVNEIVLPFTKVSTNGISPVRLQLGSGSIQTTGYESKAEVTGAGTATSTGGFDFYVTAATDVCTGRYVLTRQSGNTWVCIAQYGRYVGTNNGVISGEVTLSGALDRLRITTVGATDTFDGGILNSILK